MANFFFHTIRARLVSLMLSMLFILCALAAVFTYRSYLYYKELKIEACDLAVAHFAENVNKSISILQENALDLALTGEMYHKLGKFDKKIFDLTVKQNFENNPIAIGGGIWYEPFKVSSKTKLYCAYAFKSKDGVIIDPSFETQAYDYLNQSWYLSIKKFVGNKQKVSWTSPYFDDTGTHALMTTAGAGIFDSNGEFIGMSTVDWILDEIIKQLSGLRPTNGSFVLFASPDNDYIIASINGENINAGASLKTLSWYDKVEEENRSKFNYNGENYIVFKRTLDNNMLLLVSVPQDELLQAVLARIKTVAIILLITCLAVTLGAYYILRKYINAPINYLVNITTAIGGGDLDTKIELYDPEEFANLADSFNKMTKDIKSYIKNLSDVTAEKQRIESDLEIGKTIQLSAMPNVFPPYPEHTEFDIYASMNAAKEVGGDFYDFFFLDANRLLFLIADVSGKGVPAALFMMTTKTIIKNLAKSDISPMQLLTNVNEQIAKQNEQDMFVTVFMCVLDINTGKLTCVNGGHNPPIVKRTNGECQFFKTKSDMALGVFEGITYNEHELILNKGDAILLYTDGVTEALNPAQELYGEERLLNLVKNSKQLDLKNSLEEIKEDLFKFADGEPRADDITMISLRYNGKAPS